ncbi:MAG: thioredoxin domain-containing protein, partial [Acidobacteriota bacterium]
GGPFYAGTYFPPQDRHGMPSFRRVLQQVSGAWQTRRADVEAAQQDIRDAIASDLRVPPGERALIDREVLDTAASRIAQNYDPVHGGFGGAPKFPPSMTLDFLMQVADRTAATTSSATLKEIIVNTLTKMARGGMYDQVGGGFHRYSVDARWLVPHFEKMLYDNALLARLYTRAWQWTKEPLFARVANETLDFVVRELRSPDGGFYSTLDADSEGVEGKFYVWSRAEVMNVLGDEEGRAFCTLYDVTEHGNWEETNILNVPRDPALVAGDLGITLDQLADSAARGKCKLYGARSLRVRPGRDEKILAGWNGWMLAAFAEGAIAFGGGKYGDVVRANADFLLTRILDRRLMRTPKIAGLLEDYSGAAWGLTLAYEAVHDRRYLDAARQLVEQILARFADEERGGFYDTPIDHEKLITRPKDLFDNATPGGNSVTADVLLRLALIFEEERYAEVATRTLEAIWPLAVRYPSGFGFLLSAAEWRSGRPKEIAITGPDPAALLHVIGETYLPHRVLIAGSGSEDLPLMQNRPPDQTLAYVCEGYACLEPTNDPERLHELLSLGS